MEKEVGSKGKKPVVLSHNDERILRSVHFYRYMTALDIAHLLYKPSSIRRVRTVLADLCGKADYVPNQFLCRFRMPAIEAGNPERIYSLGARGRSVLIQEFGIPVNWYMSPEKGVHPNFSQLTHDLILTRFLIAAERFAAVNPNFRLVNTRICYEIGAALSDAGERGKREKVSVVPDGWLLFERVIGGSVEQLPVLVEIDRGTMDRNRIKKHVLSRIEFVRSGEYRRMFGVEAVVVAYATTGAKGELDEGRRRRVCAWTMEALKESGHEDWASVFRFASVDRDTIYGAGLFDGAVWYMPDSKNTVSLFE
jgi:hypothetical protein